MSTHPNSDQPSSRLALWLDIDDLRWLAQHLETPMPIASPSAQRECADRIRFWALAALRKAGHQPSDGSET